jgi:uncharacterized protein (DUF2235 family)
VKNIALCFDRARATNATALAGLLSRDAGQLVWSPPDTSRQHTRGLPARRAALVSARETVAQAYRFLVREWETDDHVFLFGSGIGASCATALARLLGYVGVLNADLPGWTAEDFRSYVLSTYVLPRTAHDRADWERIGRLAADLSGRTDLATDVEFLGLWDSRTVPGLPRPHDSEPPSNVVATRHAVAIDGGIRAAQLLGDRADAVQEVWFRGAHCDVTGGPDGCRALADIALDWILDGAVQAGLVVPPGPRRAAPNAVDALAGDAHTMSLRSVPAGAAVHASVRSYVHAHPSYWRRLPAELSWCDLDWAARSERLTPAPQASAPSPGLAEIRTLATAS